MKKPLIIITGPTACGKTDISIELAKKINGEIISADSMQVYKYMNIGTAKPSKAEMCGIKHYLIDELYPDEEFNAMVFQSMAKKYIEEIYSKGKIPIIVGGTGFYINALVYDNNFMSTDDDGHIRRQLYDEAEKYGKCYMYEKLKKIDPEYAAIVHENNLKRVIRAIEYYIQTGEKMSEHNNDAKNKQSPYNVSFFILSMDRTKLYDRINQRVDIMISNGLTEEVKKLIDMGYGSSIISMQGIGYKELIPYINGKMELDEAINILKQSTRRFAKRQLTWFRQKTDGIWIDVTEKDKETTVRQIIGYLKNGGAAEI